MKYKIISWENRKVTGQYFNEGDTIELEPIIEPKIFSSPEEEKPKPSYKVGDKVRVIGNEASFKDDRIGSHRYKIGSIVEIIGIDGDCADCFLNDEDYNWSVHVDDLRPYTENQVKPDSTDDSWKVKYQDYFAKHGFIGDIDGWMNSKIEPWVDKCRELEARNKSLVEAAETWERLSMELAGKYDALKEVADEMSEYINNLINTPLAKHIVGKYAKLTK